MALKLRFQTSTSKKKKKRDQEIDRTDLLTTMAQVEKNRPCLAEGGVDVDQMDLVDHQEDLIITEKLVKQPTYPVAKTRVELLDLSELEGETEVGKYSLETVPIEQQKEVEEEDVMAEQEDIEGVELTQVMSHICVQDERRIESQLYRARRSLRLKAIGLVKEAISRLVTMKEKKKAWKER